MKNAFKEKSNIRQLLKPTSKKLKKLVSVFFLLKKSYLHDNICQTTLIYYTFP